MTTHASVHRGCRQLATNRQASSLNYKPMHNYGEFSTVGLVLGRCWRIVCMNEAVPLFSEDEIKEYNEREVFVDVSKKLGEGGLDP